jgi:putative oxidoreductase
VTISVSAFVALASAPIAAVLLAAMLTVHLPYGFRSIKLQAVTVAGGSIGPSLDMKIHLLDLACLTTLVLGGSGPFAVDSIPARPSPRQASTSDRCQDASWSVNGLVGKLAGAASPNSLS